MKRKSIVLFLTILCHTSFAQTDVIPPSPTVEKLIQQINYKSNNFTGVHEVTIPLYTIKEGDLTLPIYLRYQASGVKVSDANGFVGLEWSLHAGGVISRSIIGPADEVTAFQTPLKMASAINPNNIDHQYLSQLEEWGNSEYDIFSYMTPSMGGQFIMKRDSNNKLVAVTIPYDPVKISQTMNNSNIDFFDVYDTKGIQYRFGKSISDGSLAKESTSSLNTTGWYLTEVLSPLISDNFISIKYSSVNENRSVPSHNLIVDADYYNDNSNAYPPGMIKVSPVFEQNYGYTYLGRKIQEISFKSGKIVFEGTSGMIDSMSIFDSNNKLIKKIAFEKEKFPNQSSRVKLKKLNFYDSNSEINSQYEFGYEENPVIPQRTNGIDYWGYFNGKTGNTNLVPAMTIVRDNGGLINIGGANRSSDENYMKAYILTSIKYPTGGVAEFEYEANRYWSGGIKQAGGLRISVIRELDGEGEAIVKKYKYGSNESGYGELTLIPHHDLYSHAQEVLFNPYPSNISNAYNYKKWICSSSPHVDLTPFGSPVIYRDITEYIGDELQNSGKTHYVFDYNPQPISFYSINNSSNFSKNKAYLTKWFPWKSGQLKYKTVYKNLLN